jgi:hypothetical protein
MKKRLIVCCDGTWNAPEINNPRKNRATNVLKLCRAIIPEPSPKECQVVEYIPGIGTHDVIDRFLGGSSGWGISRNIQQAYQFLVNNYLPGNDIFLFGFSRGAYTVRSLSGFIEKAGLIKKTSMHLFPQAFRAYRDRKWDDFKQQHRDITRLVPNEVRIHFLGVWDTVGALGAPTPLLGRLTRRRVSFHSTDLAANVTYAYQALALHEARSHFKPALWTSKLPWQTVEQVWFPGAHSDVGGGLTSAGLSDAALAWMMTRARAAGLAFDPQYQRDYVQPDPDIQIDISLRGMYWPFRAYVRPIGKDYLDKDVKSESLAEYIHSSATARLGKPTHWRRFWDWRKKAYLEVADERARRLPWLPEDEARVAQVREKEQEAERQRQMQEESEALRAAFIERTQRDLDELRMKTLTLKKPIEDDPGCPP